MESLPTFDAQRAIDALSEQSGMEKTLIRQRVDEKIAKFSGLLTEQGALVLLSKELNARLPEYERPSQTLKVGELKPGMNNVDVSCVVRILDRPKPYSKNGKEGKYVSARVGDETGEVLYTFWNEQADEIVQKGLRVGSTLRLRNARVGSFNQMVQLSLGYNGTWDVDNTTAPAQTSPLAAQPAPKIETNVKFAELHANQLTHAQAHVLDVLPGKGYYVKCNACGGKLQTRETTCGLCGAEGKVETRLLVSLLLDDGSKPLRGVAFESEVVALFAKSKDEILAAMDEPPAKEILVHSLVGMPIQVSGKGKLGLDNTSVELLINRVNRLPIENA